MLRSALVCYALAVASALRVDALCHIGARHGPMTRIGSRGLIAMAEGDDDEKDLERFRSSTEAAEGLELMEQFNRRLDAEGGANMFKLKTTASNVGESVSDSANQAKRAGEDAAATIEGAFNGLTTQQRNIATIVLGLIAFQILISLIGNIFGQR